MASLDALCAGGGEVIKNPHGQQRGCTGRTCSVEAALMVQCGKIRRYQPKGTAKMGEWEAGVAMSLVIASKSDATML